MNVASLVLRHAVARPDEEALKEHTSGRRRTWGELANRVVCLGHALEAECQMKRGDRVAVLSRNRIEYMEMYLACALHGFVLQALNWRLSDPELAEILTASPPRAVVYDPAFASMIEALKRAISCDQWIGWAADGGISPFEQLMVRAASSAPPDIRLESRSDGDEPFVAIYTGGSSGVSKGALHTHNTALGAMANNTVGEGIVPTDKFLLMGQMFHSPVILAINYLSHGCPVVMVNFDAGAALAAIEEERVTASMGIPIMFQNMLSEMSSRAYDVSSLCHVQYGGSPTAESVTLEMMDALGCRLLQCYGRTEELAITFLSPEDHERAANGIDRHRLQSCGRPAWLTGVRLIDANDQVIPAGSDQPGEIVAKSPATTIGYIGRPDLTAEATYADGWLRTGDVGRFDEDGYLYVVDRAKDMIISGGENIYPAQVELAIHRHPAVLEAAVIGVPDDLWGESVMAYVVLKPAQQADAAEISATVATHLGSYQKPKMVEFLDELPRTSAGKISKAELKSRAVPGP